MAAAEQQIHDDALWSTQKRKILITSHELQCKETHSGPTARIRPLFTCTRCREHSVQDRRLLQACTSLNITVRRMYIPAVADAANRNRRGFTGKLAATAKEVCQCKAGKDDTISLQANLVLPHQSPRKTSRTLQCCGKRGGTSRERPPKLSLMSSPPRACYSLDEIAQLDLPATVVGGKGRHLATLRKIAATAPAALFSVPSAVVLTTDVFASHVISCLGRDDWRGVAEDISGMTAEALRSRIASLPLPGSLVSELSEHLSVSGRRSLPLCSPPPF